MWRAAERPGAAGAQSCNPRERPAGCRRRRRLAEGARPAGRALAMVCAVRLRPERRRMAGGPVTGAGEPGVSAAVARRSEEHTSELQSQSNLVCRLLLEKKKKAILLILNHNKNGDHD